MRRSTRFVLAGVAALAVAAPAFAITGGSIDGTAHPAVGLLLADRGNGPEPDCSGALVSPTVFVTAAHCTGDLASGRVWVSLDARYVAGSSPLLPGTAHTDPELIIEANLQDGTPEQRKFVHDRHLPYPPHALVEPGRLSAFLALGMATSYIIAEHDRTIEPHVCEMFAARLPGATRGRVAAGHPCYEAYRKYLRRTIEEPFAIFLPA